MAGKKLTVEEVRAAGWFEELPPDGKGGALSVTSHYRSLLRPLLTLGHFLLSVTPGVPFFYPVGRHCSLLDGISIRHRYRSECIGVRCLCRLSHNTLGYKIRRKQSKVPSGVSCAPSPSSAQG
eukprot:1528005-Pyramimonas_sp.AAC.2